MKSVNCAAVNEVQPNFFNSKSWGMKKYFCAKKVENSSVNCRVNKIFAAALCVWTSNDEDSM